MLCQALSKKRKGFPFIRPFSGMLSYFSTERNNAAKWHFSFDSGIIAIYFLCITTLFELSKGGKRLQKFCFVKING